MLSRIVLFAAALCLALDGNSQSSGAPRAVPYELGPPPLMVQYVNNSEPVRPGEQKSIHADCPAGMIVISGGWWGPQVPGEAVLIQDEPNLRFYNVIVKNVTARDFNFRVTAVCVTATLAKK